MGLERILNKIKEYDTIMLHGHIRPDGDCLGSQFGLKDIITNTYPSKKVFVVGENSEYVSFLGKTDTVTDDMYKNALAIVVDTATQDRVSDQRFKLAKEVIKIDHHIPIDQYGDLIWVIEEAPSCAQMIGYFYYKFQNELKITKKGATALYTGILTDTGSFRYRGVDETTFQIVAMLVGKGVLVEEIDKYLSTRTLEKIQLKGHVLSNFVRTPGGLIYFKMTDDVIKKFNISHEEAAAQVNELASIEGYPVWALFIEYPNNELRIRIRSNGPDIDKLANKFQGGGHAKAAGGHLDSWDQVPEFIKEAEKTIATWLAENKGRK